MEQSCQAEYQKGKSSKVLRAALWIINRLTFPDTAGYLFYATVHVTSIRTVVGQIALVNFISLAAVFFWIAVSVGL
jgi:hypothetical protein